jgi:type II secretory pathway component PulM
MSAIARFRHGRSEREVRVVMALAAIVALLLVFAFVWLPLERARTRLQSELPTLRASLDAMRAQAAEAKRLRAMPLAANRAAPLATLASSPPAGCQATVLDPRRVRLTAADASFTTIVEWLGAAQASHGLHVDSAHLEALGPPGRVKADIVLARP